MDWLDDDFDFDGVDPAFLEEDELAELGYDDELDDDDFDDDDVDDIDDHDLDDDDADLTESDDTSGIGPLHIGSALLGAALAASALQPGGAAGPPKPRGIAGPMGEFWKQVPDRPGVWSYSFALMDEPDEAWIARFFAQRDRPRGQVRSRADHRLPPYLTRQRLQ